MLQKSSLMTACAVAAIYGSAAFAATDDQDPRETPGAAVSSDGAVTAATPAPPSSEIEDIVVSARRTNESAQSVPLAISVLTSAALTQANVTEVRDIARLTPGFQALTATDPTNVLLTIRGQSTQDRLLTTDSPIGVYVDGVNYARTSNLDAAFIDIERAEILKGPQGTLFGKNTTGGAINITTRQPDLDDFGGYLKGSIGNYDAYDILGVVNAPIVTDKLGVRLMAMHRERSGYGQDFFGRQLNTKNQEAFRLNVLFQPNDAVRWSLSADYTRTEGSGPIVRLITLNQVPSTVTGTPAIAPAYTAIAVETGLLDRALLANPTANATAILAAATQARALLANALNSDFYSPPLNVKENSFARTYGFSSNFSVDLLPNLQFRSITGARYMSNDSLPDLDGSQYNVSEVDLFQTGVRNLTQELQFASQGNRVFDWLLGAYFNDETGKDGSVSFNVRPISTANPNVFDADVENSSWAVFGQTVIQISDTLRTTLGLRWTEDTREIYSRNRVGPAGTCNVPVAARLSGQCLAHFKSSFSDYSYLASVDWKATPGVLLYGRTGRGFKAGGQNLRGNASSVESFAPFRPELVTDYEVGVKSDFLNRRVRLNAAVFHSDYSNIQRTILLATASGGVASLVTNAAKARIQGVEGDLTVVPLDGLTLTASGSITDAKYKKFVDVIGDRSNEKFPFPKYSAALGASYSLPTSFGSARLSANYSWTSKADYGPAAKNVGALVQPALGLIGGRITLAVRAIDADISVFGKNLTNRKYIVNGIQFDSSVGYNSAFVGEPRIVGLELTKRFGGE